MSSNTQNYDISYKKKSETNETEMVEVNSNNIKGKDSGYSHLNINENENENENSISTEYLENNDNEDFNDLKEQFNDSTIINNPLVKQNENIKQIKYRKGNLHTFFYNNKGIPRIVIGPDCKFY